LAHGSWRAKLLASRSWPSPGRMLDDLRMMREFKGAEIPGE